MDEPFNKVYQLKDQTSVELRFVCPQDKEQLINGLKRISSRTNIGRFHTFKKRFTELELNYLLKIDNLNHLAIGAIDHQQNREIGVGVARYIRSSRNAEHAEVAIIVIDKYQGKGLGKILYFELMQHALKNNIKTFINIIGKDNWPMLCMLEKFDGVKIAEHEYVYEYAVNIDITLSRIKSSAIETPYYGKSPYDHHTRKILH